MNRCFVVNRNVPHRCGSSLWPSPKDGGHKLVSSYEARILLSVLVSQIAVRPCSSETLLLPVVEEGFWRDWEIRFGWRI
jgi:hypothetical protein